MATVCGGAFTTCCAHLGIMVAAKLPLTVVLLGAGMFLASGSFAQGGMTYPVMEAALSVVLSLQGHFGSILVLDPG